MRKLMVGAAGACAAVALMAAPAAAGHEVDHPEGEARVTIDGFTPVCVNIVKVSLTGTQLVHVTKTCVLE